MNLLKTANSDKDYFFYPKQKIKIVTIPEGKIIDIGGGGEGTIAQIGRGLVTAVDKRQNDWYLTGSRAIALVGIGNDIEEAERLAEDAAKRIKGPVRYRKDIGTNVLIQKRVDHIKKIMYKKESLSFSYPQRSLTSEILGYDI